MDVSDLRKRILRALDDARKDASSRRMVVDQATRAYEEFLEKVAVPLLRQTQAVLKAEGQLFAVQTPAGSARLVSERTPLTFLEIVLDASGAQPEILGRVSVARGREGVIIQERPIAGSKPIAEAGEEDLAPFLIAEVSKLVVR